MTRTPLHRQWTEEESQQLRDYIGRGGSIATAAVRFGRTEGSVRTHAKMMGVKFQTVKERRQRMMGTVYPS